MLDAEHDVVAVAKTRSLEALRVVKSAKPVYYDVSLVLFDDLGR